MFFRDELLSWSWRKPLGIPMAPVVGGGNLNAQDFKHKVTNNVDNVIGRINGIAPQYFCEEVIPTVAAALKSLCYGKPACGVVVVMENQHIGWLVTHFSHPIY